MHQSRGHWPALIARGVEQKSELLKQSGGTLSVSDVAKLLGISRNAVDRCQREGTLLAVSHEADYVYPACQFDGDHVVPGVGEVLKEIGFEHGWAALAFLITPDDRLGGLSPLDALRREDVRLNELMLRFARAIAGDGFS